jgi:hypothetical protein
MPYKKNAFDWGKVDHDLLLLAVLSLVLLVGGEGLLLGWGIDQALGSVSQVPWPDRFIAIIEWLALILIPLIGVNAALGAFIAYRLSAPLVRMREAINDVTRGDLEHELGDIPGGLLPGYTEDCRRMLQTLRKLLYRDYQFSVEASALLAQCRDLYAGPKAGEPEVRDRLDGLVNEARSKLSVINHHFLKGRRDLP